MSQLDEHRRRRWMRPDADRYIRPDAHRFMPPGFRPELQGAAPSRRRRKSDPGFDAELRRLRCDFASLRLEWALAKFAWSARKYNPNQPRVPAGNPDGGQWTSDGTGSGRVRTAAGDKPRLGPAAVATLALEVAKRAIEAYRKDNLFSDLFGRSRTTVTYTDFDGEDIFGSNSNSPTCTQRDEAAAIGLRDTMVSKYPDVMNTENVGGRPNDAIFHAETTILLRTARANGGTLTGRSLEIYSDRSLCWSCEKVLPHVGLELGDPTVTFVQPNGKRTTMRGGAWINEPRRP